MKNLKRFLAWMLVLGMVCSFLPVGVLAAETTIGHMATKPADGTTPGEPFPENTAGSFSFRIPALVTLSDGTLVAAADARWNTTYDGGGLDTMVSVSKDNGANWSYTFANYLGDNGNEYNGASSCFIDPSLAVYTTNVDGTDKDTIFMLCDLYPNGVALNGSKQVTPGTDTGFNAEGYLKLTAAAPNGHYSDSDFTHYLKDGKIYPNGSDTPASYSVDGKFNLFDGEGNYISNLFFADSPYHVARTGYLYLTRSTDGGKTWSDPQLLNLKTPDEMVCLVGPNGGMVTSGGVIVFPVYSYTGTTEQTGLIYSADGGSTWQRSKNFAEIHSSEADAVELPNGKLRVFFRNQTSNLCYADYDLTTDSWGRLKNTLVFTNSNTELSAITYSKGVMHEGKQKDVILVSCPASANLAGSYSSDGSWRTSGRIFAGLVDPDTCEMTWLSSSVDVTPVADSQLGGSSYTADQGFFAYSSITEQKDNGTVSILYEDNQFGWGVGDDFGYTLAYKTYSQTELEEKLGIDFIDNSDPDVPGEDDGDENPDAIPVDLKIGETQTFTDTTGNYETFPGNVLPDAQIAGMTVKGEDGKQDVAADPSTTLTAGTYLIVNTRANKLVNNTSYSQSAGAGTMNGLSLSGTTTSFNAAAAVWTIAPVNGGYTVQDANGKYMTIDSNKCSVADEEHVLSLVYANGNWTLSENGAYLNDAAGAGTTAAGWQNNSAAGDVGSQFQIYAYSNTIASTEITFEGKMVGNTTATVGNTQYNITVTSDVANYVDVELEVGKSKTVTDSTGNYENNVVKEPDNTIATMQVKGTSVEGGVTTEAIETLIAGNSFYIEVGKGEFITADGSTTTDFSQAELWTAANVASYYCTIRNTNNDYLGERTNYSGMGVSDTTSYLKFSNGQLLGYYTSSVVGTPVNVSVADPVNATEITFQGQKAGTTTAIVGTTQYNITVLPQTTKTVDITVNVDDTTVYVDDSGEFNDITIAPDAGIAAVKILAQPIPVTEIESGRQYLIVNKNSSAVLTNKVVTVKSNAVNWGDKTGLDTIDRDSAGNQYLWTITATENGHTVVMNNQYLTAAGFYANMSGTETGLILTHTDNGWTICDNVTCKDIESLEDPVNYYLSDDVGSGYGAGALGTSDTNNACIYWDIYEVNPNSTVVEFTGIAEGEAVAVIGTTRYNITVAEKQYDEVNIELEIGESFTFHDTTGNHTDKVAETPDETYATMAVVGTVNSTVKDVEKITAATFDTNSRYILENVRAKNAQPNASVLTSDEAYGGLVMNGPLDAATSKTWMIIPDDNDFQLFRNSEYVAIGSNAASMEGVPFKLTFEYIQNQGWLISYNGNYLSDLNGTGSGEAYGYNNRNDDGNYWNIYKEIDRTTSEGTQVTFTGVAEGTATAIVGNTRYNITVVPRETDDEVMYSATGIWTVDPEVQHQHYNSLIGLEKDLFTDDSWTVYEAARQAAYRKLIQVTNAQYDSQEKAAAALAELTALVSELDAAEGQLVSAKTISIRYQLDSTLIDTREYKVAADETSLTLPATIVVDGIAYTVPNTEITLGGDTVFDVPVIRVGKLGAGFVASKDIKASDSQIADLVDEVNNVAKKITEMTVTVGIKYDLNPATDTTGKTVEWTSENDDVATVDGNGFVTATGEGTTNITATVKDANGKILEVNTIPITVFPKGTGERTTAIYIDQVDNTNVWCVINANTDDYSFQLTEGELIYGLFDTTVSDNTQTTAISFFAAPDEAHALVYMKSTGSDDHYYQLHDKQGNLYDGDANEPSSSYYISGTSSGAGYWQAVGLTGNDTSNSNKWAPIKDMVRWAIGQGCDGGLGFTRRQKEGALASSLSFASDPMPRIEKTVDGVLPTTRKQANYRPYVENMVAAVQEQAYFKITVTQEVPTVWLAADPGEGIQAETVGAIEYFEAILKDSVLKGAYLYTQDLDKADGTWDGNIAPEFREQYQDITENLNRAWTEEEKAAGMRTLEFFLVYEIQESDIPKFWIDNIAELSYDYQSHYSTGAQAGAADAEARITVVGTDIDDVVIDFGQTVTYTGLTNAQLKGVYVDGENDVAGITQCKASAKYGSVSVTRTPLLNANGEPQKDDSGYPLYDYTVTYTPHSILQETDAVVLYGIGENNQEKVINGFLVYPATTVYYEEGFMMNDASTWKHDEADRATGDQRLELLGKSQYSQQGAFVGKVSDKQNPYGFDGLYEQAGYTYGDSFASADTIGQTTTFTITGTGFDLYANCTVDTGYVSVIVKNSAGKFVKMYTVDTVVKGGETPATQGKNGAEFHLPIVSVDLGKHDTYTITVTKIMETEPVKLDGIRVHNTLADSSVFNIDLEDNPEFYQLRDYVLKAVDVNSVASKYYGPDWLEQNSIRIGALAEQVYGTVSTGAGAPAVVYSVEDIYGDDSTAQDLLDNGPKNELFLYPEQSLSFRVTTSRAMQIGLKAPRVATSYDLYYTIDGVKTEVATDKTLQTSVDMFYALNNPIGTEREYLVTIANTGKDILSVTDLKICDDPNAAFVPLTVEDIEQLLRGAGLHDAEDGGEVPPIETDPSTPSEPAEPEPSEPAVLQITQQASDYAGAVGDTAVFTVVAEGKELQYQWFYYDAAASSWLRSSVSGFNTPTLQPTLYTHRDGYQYKCVVTDLYGNSVTSDAVTMTVKTSEVTITQQPASVENAALNQLYHFTVAAEGENLTYLWEYSTDNGTTWEQSWNDGYNTTSLSVRMYSYRDGYQYRCVVTSGQKTVVVTEAATLNLQKASAEIVTQPVNVTVVSDATATFTVEATGMDLTYAWYRSNDKGATWTQTYLSGYDTNTLSFTAIANRAAMYMCKITDGSGFSVWSNPVKLQILTGALQILTQPESVTCAAGETAIFTVEAQGDNLRYQWYASADGGETWSYTFLPGYNTAEFSFAVTAARAAKQYKCVITDSAGNTVETNAVSVTIG